MKQVGSSGVKDTVKKYLIVWAPKRPNSTQKGDSVPNKDVDLKSPLTVSTRPNVVRSEIPIKTATNKTTMISSVSSNKVLASSLKSTQRGQFLPDQNNTHDIGTFVSQPQLTLKNKITDEPLLKDSEKKSSVTWISILKPKKSNIDTRKEIVDTKKEIVDTKKMVQKLQGNGPFICDACGMTFSYLALLNLHKIKHKSVSKMMYYCKKCKCSVYEKDREAHERTHKKAYKPEMYICQYCGKDFPTMNKCTLHERTHLGERPFICKVCGKALVRKRNLILHEMTHAGKRPHKCRFCERRFVQKHAAINHEWVHTGEKPFKCRFCGKRFTQSGTRNSHERIHTNVRTFHCQYCRKVFAYERECVKHEAVHKDIKS
ncbi:zinc finger protein 286A [Lingula anatina]|uniref:Zinc finger protein 286A n=1 Tax=Lingula anatina TaxID=7574 RepID=A0A1S3H400_LINAN|nr:zinc finger protein 286A [Lingula anatina]|eukprot:XP_013380865.1 zinc finger protein 286A [Lingula anatina]